MSMSNTLQCSESELKAIKESILKFYEAIDSAIADLESLKHFALRMAMASDLSGIRLYLDHIEASVKGLQKRYNELLKRFVDLKSLVTDPQKRLIRSKLYAVEWSSVISEAFKQK